MLITVRLIKSFEYRNFKNLVLNDVDPLLKVKDLMQLCCEKIKGGGFKAYLNHNFDTLKVYVKAHGSKTSNLIINLDHDENIMDPEKTLQDYGVEHETEISFFNLEAYRTFQQNPKVDW